jgi:hypothetical protein
MSFREVQSHEIIPFVSSIPKRRQKVPPKRRHLSTRIHLVTSQKTIVVVLTAVRISNSVDRYLLQHLSFLNIYHFTALNIGLKHGEKRECFQYCLNRIPLSL